MAKIENYVLSGTLKCTSDYGKRKDPKTGKEGVMHNGRDLISLNGDRNIYAVEDGYVASVRTGQNNVKTGWGNYIWVRYPRTGKSLFHAHCSKILLKKGDTVKKGDIVAIMGSTGKSTGTHLHFGMTDIGKNAWLNPGQYNYIPPSTVALTVYRDETKNQLKVLAKELRIRSDHNTTSSIIGVAAINGIYNYYDKYDGQDYTWYKIADNQWIANINIEVYPGEDDELMDELRKQVEELSSKCGVLEQDKQDLETKVLELSNSLSNEKTLFKCLKNGLYKIKLKKGETLLIK